MRSSAVWCVVVILNKLDEYRVRLLQPDFRIFQKVRNMALRCIFNVNSYLSGFRPQVPPMEMIYDVQT